jgi:hypothetical protein
VDVVVVVVVVVNFDGDGDVNLDAIVDGLIIFVSIDHAHEELPSVMSFRSLITSWDSPIGDVHLHVAVAVAVKVHDHDHDHVRRLLATGRCTQRGRSRDSSRESCRSVSRFRGNA